MTDPRWNIHKFGGTSVATAQRYRQVAAILEARRTSHNETRQAVVVSAVRGVTDTLVGTVAKARNRDASYQDDLAALESQQRELILDLLPGEEGAVHRDELGAHLDREMEEVRDVLRVVWLLRSENGGPAALVSGYGELWSSRLLTHLLIFQGRAARWVDARAILVAEAAEPVTAVDWDVTRSRLEAWLAREKEDARVLVIPGYVASNLQGIPTTLGRNGSDFSASVFGSLLGVEAIHIWTDVDGIMSADPRRVPEAVRLDTLSYNEAMELAYFGAKVLHPGTMAPAVRGAIPVFIRNTLNPDDPGTRIHLESSPDFAVKGFATIESVALLNVEGSGMVGVPGIAQRLFGGLREAGVSVIMISQAGSEHSICLAVPAASAQQARRAVEEVFVAEIHMGRIQTVEVDPDCCILAVVGDGMAGHAGVAGRFFGALGKAGINVRAIAQGSSERNISVVVGKDEATRALRAVHSGFYLSRQTLSVGIIGRGVVGGALLDQFAAQLPLLKEELNVDIRIRGVASSTRMHLHATRLELTGWRDDFHREGTRLHLDDFVDHIQADHIPHAVLIDCTASGEVADRYREWLERGIHVITPNKRASTGSLEYYRAIKKACRDSGMHYLYETTVGAGLPIIQTLRELIQTGDRVLEIQGVFSGSLSYLFNAFDGTRPFSEMVSEARDMGYTEPDPRDDLSGMDVARKLVILGREIGMELDLDDLEVESLVPGDLQEAPVDAFMAALPDHDARMHGLWEAARLEGKVLRYVGTVSRKEGARVRLEAYGEEHPFARIRLSDNIVQFRTRRYNENPLIVQGPGAGPDVTAGGIFADLLRVAAYV
ncbi:MAG: bifunctional aspartate kinase/homoserine dehydrogenase I [Gemmatimonadota bacterium]